jgi:hypothetical protein
MSDAPSDPWTFDPQCHGKTVYSTRADALAVTRRMKEKRRQHSAQMRSRTPVPYECESCGRWHIGGFNKKGVKA